MSFELLLDKLSSKDLDIQIYIDLNAELKIFYVYQYKAISQFQLTYSSKQFKELVQSELYKHYAQNSYIKEKVT